MIPERIEKLDSLLSACIDQSYQSSAFHPVTDGTITRPDNLAYAVKDKRSFVHESPMRSLAFELLGIDFFKTTFRNWPKKAHAPLRPFVEEHFKNFTAAFDAVLSGFNELPKAWLEEALEKPLCGLSEAAQDVHANIIYGLPYFPFHQGWLSKKELRRAFESKIKRTDQIDLFALRGFPKSPWDQDDMIASYLYGILHPEIWAGMWAWQFTTSQLFAALFDTTTERIGDYPNDWLGIYRQNADMLSRVCIKALFPIFLLPGIAAHQLEQPSVDLLKTITAQGINRGLINALSKGAFASVARDDDGQPLKFSCPFNGTGTRLLMLELDNGMHSLAAFCMNMQGDNAAKPLLDTLRQELAEHCLNRCNPRVMKRFMQSSQGRVFYHALQTIDDHPVIAALLKKYVRN
ncbi:MAG: hypothetical protein EB059_02475 [Alphaproteobacteria bacterium]|nr:hypothetical protein [Alphaproteobacteria bacterium]